MGVVGHFVSLQYSTFARSGYIRFGVTFDYDSSEMSRHIFNTACRSDDQLSFLRIRIIVGACLELLFANQGHRRQVLPVAPMAIRAISREQFCLPVCVCRVPA
jgi:hypothetical protein